MNAELTQILAMAQNAKACAPGLTEVQKFETVEQALASEHGPLMASLFAIKVKKSRVPEFENAIRQDKYALAAYCTAFGKI